MKYFFDQLFVFVRNCVLNRRLQRVRLPLCNLKRCTCTCLTVLLLYMALTLLLSFGGNSLFSRQKAQDEQIAVLKSLLEDESSNKRTHVEASSDQQNVKFNVKTQAEKINEQQSGMHRISEKSWRYGAHREPLAPKDLVATQNLLVESPFETASERISSSTEPAMSATNPAERIGVAVKASLGPELNPKTLMQRIERASDPGLHSQMRAKLKSLGSAVTQEQLRSAANKCGGMNPELRHVQTYDFVRMADHLCTAGELLALVAVHSNAKNLDRRATIRRTWGSLRYIGRFRVEVAFFLGRPAVGDSDESGATGAQLEALIDAESSRFGDIVQLNYTENYRNMTIKHLAVYEWLLRHCSSARYLVKVDDDTFTDVAHLATFLSKGSPSGFYCSATQNAMAKRVFRGLKSKWDVSYKEFPGRTYPTYCEGYGYILDTVYITDIYLCSLFKKFFWIDDVHVTGILASAAGVPVTRFWRGHGYTLLIPSLASESIMDYIFLTAERSEVFRILWHKLWHSVLQHSLDGTL